MSKLSEKYRVIAVDLPGFGFSDAPVAGDFEYTFEHFADLMVGFTDAIGLRHYALFVSDYVAPVGFRLAALRPQCVSCVISNNGNIYEEGLAGALKPIGSGSEAGKGEVRVTWLEDLRFQSAQHRRDHPLRVNSTIAPETFLIDEYLLARPGNAEVQRELFLDYKANITAYPLFQNYLGTHRPPTLVIWDKSGPFSVEGAKAFRRGHTGAEIHVLDTGHFPFETHVDETARIIRTFLARTLDIEQGDALFGALDESSVPPASDILLQALREMFGFVPNLGYAIAVEPSVLSAYVMMLNSLYATSLDPVAQQVAMVAASRANAAEYSVYLHTTLAETLGAPPEVIKALHVGEPIGDPGLDAVRRFANAIASGKTHVSDSDVKALRAAGLDHRAAVAIALAVAAKTLVDTVAHLSRPDIDSAFRQA